MTTVFTLLVILLSTIIHEIAHGAMAYRLGDPTAKYAGRLTWNPLKHLDPFGSVILPLMLLVLTNGRGPVFGWAKPVPINPYNFRDRKWGTLKVSLAGPATNFLIGVFFALLDRIFLLPANLEFFFSLIAIYNFIWAIFNLVPIPPLDGHWILFSFLPPRFDSLKTSLLRYGNFILIFFIFFGLNWVYTLAEFLYFLVRG